MFSLKKSLINFKVSTLFVSTLLLSSCITPNQKKAFQQDIHQLQVAMALLQENISHQFKLMAKNTKAAFTSQSNVDTLQNQINENQGEIDALKVKLKKTEEINSTTTQSTALVLLESQKKLEMLQRQIVRLELQLEEKKSTSTTSTTNSSAQKPFRPKNATELTKILKRDYENGKFKEVLEKSTTILNTSSSNKNINAEMKEIALQFRGEAQFELKNYNAAAVDLSNFIEQYPNSKRRGRALLLLGDGFIYLKKQSPALSYYNECVKDYTNTSEGSACAERIATISR